MHSSRMRDAYCLLQWPSLLVGGGLPGSGGGVSAALSGGGVFAWSEGSALTHACENITLPQLRCGR